MAYFRSCPRSWVGSVKTRRGRRQWSQIKTVRKARESAITQFSYSLSQKTAAIEPCWLKRQPARSYWEGHKNLKGVKPGEWPWVDIQICRGWVWHPRTARKTRWHKWSSLSACRAQKELFHIGSRAYREIAPIEGFRDKQEAAQNSFWSAKGDVNENLQHQKRQWKWLMEPMARSDLYQITHLYIY